MKLIRIEKIAEVNQAFILKNWTIDGLRIGFETDHILLTKYVSGDIIYI